MLLREPARGRFRWKVLTLITVSHIVGATGQYGINTLAPFYQHDLVLSRAQIGLFFTAFYLGMAGLSFGAGWLADRFGVRATTLNGHLSLGLFTVAASLAPSFSWAFVSFFLAGLGYSFLNPASTKGVMAWFHRDERATAMGIKQTGVPAGGVVTALLAPQIVLLSGWRAALASMGLINLVFGFLFWALWREPEDHARVAARPYTVSQRFQGRFNVRGLIGLSSGTALLLIGQMALLSYIPLYLKEGMGFSSYWASQALALAQLGGTVGRIGWGVVSDRLFRGARKSVLILVGSISVALSLALGLFPADTSLFVLMGVVFLCGLCMVGYQGVSYALIGEIAGRAQTGAAMGMVITVNSLGAIFGTPLFGYLVDVTGSYATAWRALAATILLGILALVFFLREPEASQAEGG